MAIRVQIQHRTRGGNRAMDARAANDRIAEKAQQLRFVSRVPMVCECSRPSCRTVVMISISEYRKIRESLDCFLTAPGHQVHGAELEKATEDYAILRSRHDRESDTDLRSA